MDERDGGGMRRPTAVVQSGVDGECALVRSGCGRMAEWVEEAKEAADEEDDQGSRRQASLSAKTELTAWFNRMRSWLGRRRGGWCSKARRTWEERALKLGPMRFVATF